VEHGRVVLPLGGVAVHAPAFADFADLEAVEHGGVVAGGVVAGGVLGVGGERGLDGGVFEAWVWHFGGGLDGWDLFTTFLKWLGYGICKSNVYLGMSL